MSFKVNPFGRVLSWEEGGMLVLAPSHVDNPLSFSGGIWTRYPVAEALPHDGLLVDFEERWHLGAVQDELDRHAFSEDDDGNTESFYSLAASREWPWRQSVSVVTSQRQGCIVLYQVKVGRDRSCANTKAMPAQAVINVHLPSTLPVTITGPAPFIIGQALVRGKLRLHTVGVAEAKVKEVTGSIALLELTSPTAELGLGDKMQLSIMLSYTK